MRFLKVCLIVTLAAFAIIMWAGAGLGVGVGITAGFDGGDWAMFLVFVTAAIGSTAGAITLSLR